MSFSQTRTPVAAVINTAPDTVDMLKAALQLAGFIVPIAYVHDIREGKLDLQSFIATHQPDVIVYDIAPPYERNWQFLLHLRRTTLRDCRFVLTSVNCKYVEELVGRDEKVYEVVGKAEDLESIVQATREAAKARDVA